MNTILTTFLGALISGLVGVALFFIKTRADQRSERKAWYQKTTRLARRVERAQKDEYEDMEGWYARSTCAGVLTRLARHMENAPSGIDGSVLDASEDLLVECQWVLGLDEGNVKRKPHSVHKRMETAAEKASKLVDAVESAITV